MKTCLWLVLSFVASRPVFYGRRNSLDLHISRGWRQGDSRKLISARSLRVRTRYFGDKEYYIDLSIGTPLVPHRLNLDLSSGKTWINTDPDHQPYLDIGASQSFELIKKPNSSSFTNETFAGCDECLGSDLVKVEDKLLRMEFGIHRKPSSFSSLGLGVTDSSDPIQPKSLLEVLRETGTVSSLSFSLWLGNEGDANELTLGTINTAKFHGNLTLLPMVDQNSAAANQRANSTTTVLHTILGPNCENYTVNKYITFDSSTSISHLPFSLIRAIAKMVNAKPDGPVFVIDCNTTAHIHLNFSGQHIPVRIRDVVLPHDESLNKCRLPLSNVRHAPYTLGTAFFRSMYLVFDLERLEIGIAPARLTNTTESPTYYMIEAGIPFATTAPLYHNTLF